MDTTREAAIKQTLEAFLKSSDFAEGVTASTKASWGGSGYSVELLPDGTWNVEWNNRIGNLYNSPGIILSLPTWDDSDYQKCVNGDDPEWMQTEEEYFADCALYQGEEKAQEMRDEWSDKEVMYSMTQGQITEKWANMQLDEATDDMIAKNITITPASLSEFFTRDYGLPLNEQEAQEWLSTQEWWEQYKNG